MLKWLHRRNGHYTILPAYPIFERAHKIKRRRIMILIKRTMIQNTR